MTVWRILCEHRMHPYRIFLHQELSEDDHLHCINLCLWAQERTNDDLDLFNNVLWWDEVTFRSNEEVNRHKMRYWAYEDPHWMREVKVLDFERLVWHNMKQNNRTTLL